MAESGFEKKYDKTNFSLLEGTARILVLEDNPQSVDLIEDILDFVPIYMLYHAQSSAQAVKLISQTKRFHIALMDLGVNDLENDEFYILRRYCNNFPILIFTGSHSPEKGAGSVLMGAKAVIDKKSPFDTLRFMKTLNHWTLIGMLNKGYDEKNWTTLNLATKILFEKMPATVTDWADLIRISDRQLRNLWEAGAKSVLHLFHLYHSAFRYYEACYTGEKELMVKMELRYTKSLEFFKTHPDLLYSLTR